MAAPDGQKQTYLDDDIFLLSLQDLTRFIAVA